MIGEYACTWGPEITKAGVRFRLWAPNAERVSIVLLGKPERVVPMERADGGWYEHVDPSATAGSRYFFEIDGEVRVPDPASRFQPEGLEGPSEVVDQSAFTWPEQTWSAPPFNELVFYELHIDTFTPEGTYAAAERHLDHLAQLGITAIEIMPLAQAPGKRNWGYDGVLHYAPSNNYGRPEDLKHFIAAAHARGLAVFLDVVYNHFGPQGNYLYRYARKFFTERHHTPWGASIDYTSPQNEPVRRYAIENACYWIKEFRFDGLRLDATQEIYDERSLPVLQELATEVHASVERPAYVVAEDDQNNLVRLDEGFDGQWNDDVHHALHAAITGESQGYYRDFAARSVALLGRGLTQGYAYQGEPSAFRDGRPRGVSSADEPLRKFVNCLQNHDQVGNRALGQRITHIAEPDAVRAAVAVVLLAPSPPLLFMGEEWAASTPFLFFCDFEPHLAELVREGRRNEFKAFPEFSDPHAREMIPDPGLPETMHAGTLRWNEVNEPEHAAWLAYYRKLLHLRRQRVAPFAGEVRGRDTEFKLIEERGLCAQWRLGERVLRLETNLSGAPLSGFDERASGELLFATHGAVFEDGLAPPWSVRWSLI